MTVESASFVSGLVPAYPPGSDSISEGDDHLRLIKSVLQGTFPNANAAMNGIHTGTSEPTSTTAGQLWFDTTLNVLKIRNEADGAWVTLGASPVTDFKILGSNTVGWIPPTADGSPNQFLTTDGSGNLDWASAAGDELPSQTGHSGKYLTTNGTSASWASTATSGFYATMSNGTLADGSEVKQAFDTDTGTGFDLNTEYDTSLYRFTPTNAGYYFITHTISVNSVLSVSQYGKVLQAQIWKDGAKTYESVGIKFPYNGNNEMTSSVTAIAYSDGTDYWEPYAYQNCGSTVATVGGSSSRFMAIRVA